nr:MAG TPA: hypothetical protein [Caudoviricetes sp.]
MTTKYMILSQEDNSSPALMSRAFSLLKIPTLSDGHL